MFNLGLIRKAVKIVSGVATGFSVKHVIDDVLGNNLTPTDPEKLANQSKWSVGVKAGAVYIGSAIIATLVSDAAQKHVNTSIDKVFDSLNKTFKTDKL